MRFRVAPEAILRELKVMRAIQDQADGITVAATDRGLILDGPNADTRITVTVDGMTLVEPGTVQAPRGKLTDIIRSLACEDFAMSAEDGRLIVEEETSKFRAKLVLPAMVQNPPSFAEDAKTVTIEASHLRELIGVTQHALPLGDQRGDGRSGLQLTFDGTTQRALALDGRALARHRVTSSDGGAGVVTLHRRAVRHLLALVEDIEGTVTIKVTDHGIVATIAHRTLQTPLQALTLPDCGKLFAQALAIEAVVNCKVLGTSIRRVMALADPKDRAVDIAITTTGLDVSFGDDARDHIAATTNVTAPTTIRLSADYLMSALTAARTDEIALRVGTGLVKLSTEHSDFLIAPMVVRS